MPNFRITLLASIVLATGLSARGQDSARRVETPPPTVIPDASAPLPDGMLDTMVEREHRFNAEMRHLQPLVETYIQEFKDEPQKDDIPISDHYYLGRLQLDGNLKSHSFLRQSDLPHRIVSKLASLYELQFLPLGFAQMALVDDDFERKYYNFTFAGREILGGVGCLVIHVQPRENAGKGRFSGTIWVEDQDYNIVRFRGIYTPQPVNGFYRYLHFDSWRANVGPNLWLPAYIYSEEPDVKYGVGRVLSLRAQTRLWAYNLRPSTRLQEYTRIEFDTPGISDQAADLEHTNPVESMQQWEIETENRALDRLQALGLLAAEGENENVLQHIVDQLIERNHLDIQGAVRVRVLLTLPLESFTLGHTIVVSRGLLEMLPDQASIATVLAGELSHIALGHNLNNDRVLFREEDTVELLRPKRDPADDNAASKMTLQLLANSSYKDDLPRVATLFRTIEEHAPEIRNLVHLNLVHLGPDPALERGPNLHEVTEHDLNSPVAAAVVTTPSAAALSSRRRVDTRLDTWNDVLELMNTNVSVQAAKPDLLQLMEIFPALGRVSTNDDTTHGTTPNSSAPVPR